MTAITVLDKAQEIAAAIQHVMGDELNLQTPTKYLLLRDGNFIFVLGVMDVQNLRGSIHKYTREELLHQLSTAVGGLPVVLSNHSGLRYAVSMTKPRLPKVASLPEGQVARDLIPFGVSLRGGVSFHANKVINLILCGSQGSGKSAFLRFMAHINRRHGSQLYLADPMMHTFNPDMWNGLAAQPVAGSKQDVLRLIEQLHAEMEARSVKFREAAKDGLLPNDIDEYNTLTEHPLPRLWLIGDEMNTYMDDRRMQERLGELARQGRKWGIHIVLAAHSWRDADIPRGFSALFPSRLCLRVADNTSGPVTLMDSRRGKEPMKFRVQGRAMLLVQGIYQKVQLYYSSPEEEREWLSGTTSDQSSVISALTEEEGGLVRRSLNEAEGKMTIETLTGWGIGQQEARRLLERWEVRGWLEKDRTRGNARFITSKLAALVDKPTNPTKPTSPHIEEQAANKPKLRLDMAGGNA